MSIYAADDIRSKLSNVGARPRVDPATPVKPAQYIEIHEVEPTAVSDAGSKSWHIRAANCVFVWTDAISGDRFDRSAQVDEFAILMFSGSAPIRISANDHTAEVDEEAFIVVPPGDSSIEALGDGPIIRIFSAFNEDILAMVLNADAYAEPDLRCAPLVPWPHPVDGFKLRVYRLSETPITEGRFGRIFRTTNLMVNFLAEEPAPRDPLRLSPHVHDDFEQLSVAVKGEFVHHIRYPWGTDSSRWRQDDHGQVGTPSICIIPPPTIHTTQGVGPHQQLLDIFSPPRLDFSAQPGWVLNAVEYPAP
jgi:hypothetical protein